MPSKFCEVLEMSQHLGLMTNLLYVTLLTVLQW